MFAPEVGLQRVASVSMTEDQAHNLYKLLGDILHHQKVRREDR